MITKIRQKIHLNHIIILITFELKPAQKGSKSLNANAIPNYEIMRVFFYWDISKLYISLRQFPFPLISNNVTGVAS